VVLLERGSLPQDNKKSPTGTTTVKERRAMSRTSRPTYLRTSEVAGLLHVSPKTVSRWAQEGKLPFLRTLGGHRRYPDTEIRALAEELRMWPVEEPRRAESR
jgi:excisionase family DNA binding protein